MNTIHLKKTCQTLLSVHSHEHFLTKTAVTCPDIHPPSNGKIHISGNIPGSITQYQCNDGYRLTETAQRTCQYDGRWNGKAPTCTRKLNIDSENTNSEIHNVCIAAIKCPYLQIPLNGIVRVSGTIMGSSADYTCNSGFKLIGIAWRKCQDNGEWSGEPPTCQGIHDIPCLIYQYL